MTPGASMVLTGPRGARGVGRRRGRGRGRDRRLRAHHGPERRGAVLRARSRRRLPRSSTSTTATPTSCPARRRRAGAPTRDPVDALDRRRPLPGEDGGRLRDASARSSTTPPTRAASARSRCAPVMRGADRPGRRPPRALARAGSGAETAIVWDAHLGGTPVCLIGIESRNVPRDGYRPLDGPASLDRRHALPAVVEEGRARAQRGERQPAGGDAREPLGLRRLARVDAQAAARVRRRDRARRRRTSTGRCSSWWCRATTAAPTSCSRGR